MLVHSCVVKSYVIDSVYLADSLFLPTEVKQHKLGKKPSNIVEFGDRVVDIPESLVTNPDLFDVAISACTKVAADHAKERRESKLRLAKFLDQETDLLNEHADREDILDSLWQFTEGLASLIQKRENSIWGFIIRNTTSRECSCRSSTLFSAIRRGWPTTSFLTLAIRLRSRSVRFTTTRCARTPEALYAYGIGDRLSGALNHVVWNIKTSLQNRA
jgi:hypothetical protein